MAEDIKFGFEVLHKDARTGARRGVLHTAHGDVATPVFMPVGTGGAVKAMSNESLEALDARVILANTYHLYLRPGHERVERLGGLHKFMAWDRAILTDSGGYQVFSHRELRSISEEGVRFRSHLDGSSNFFTPENVIDIQRALGSDIAMVLDDCTAYPTGYVDAEASMELSMRWAMRCREQWRKQDDGSKALFGIVQGGVYPELRKRSAEALSKMEFSGMAIGGLSVGEPRQLTRDIVESTLEHLPSSQPRYLMGVGTPEEIAHYAQSGVDMMDCVLPTRAARHGLLFTSEGRLSIKQARYAQDESALDRACDCRVCQRYSRAYLRHLYASNELLAQVLNTVHNLHFYLATMRTVRAWIRAGHAPITGVSRM